MRNIEILMDIIERNKIKIEDNIKTDIHVVQS